MQLKNTKLFTILKNESMPVLIYRSRFIIAIAFATLLLLLSGCKKTVENIQQDLAQQYFEENILNRDFKVLLATDNGTDITSQFTGFTYRLTKNTFTDGPMTASNNLVTVTGTWNCTEEYGKLIINLPSTITGFSFLNREWKFTSKALPVLKFAPWGTTEPKVLHMESNIFIITKNLWLYPELNLPLT
jgi:hypothetical protein